MKVALIARDTELLHELENSGWFSKVTVHETLDQVTDQEVVLISDGLLDYKQLGAACPVNWGFKKVFYMLSNHRNLRLAENVASLCTSTGIKLIPPKLTVRQIVLNILQEVDLEIDIRGKRIAVFMGADSKVGTTMVSQSCAEYLAEHSNLKVGWFALSKKKNNEYYSDHSGIDGLKTKLFNAVLTGEELKDSCITRGNLYVLLGPENMLEYRQYHLEHVERLYQLAMSFLDVLIVDVGSDLDCGLSLGAIQGSRGKFMVTTQQESAKSHFALVRQQLFTALQIKPEDFMLVINKYLEESQLSNVSQLTNYYSMAWAGTLPHMEHLGFDAELEHKTLFKMDVSEFNGGIQAVSRVVANRLGVTLKEPISNQKQGLLQKILGFKGGI